jgi:hypothetical protein
MREWVEEGGTLIADVSPGVMTEHCRVLPKGQLDDLFGVDRSQAALKEGPAPADKPKQKELWNLRPAGAAAAADAAAWPCSAVEVGVRGTTANPLWTAQLPGGEAVPVVFHRQAGKGHAYYLACNFSGQYAAVRGKTTKEPAQVAVLVEFQQVFEKAFAAAGVRPGAVVYRRDPATGKNGVRAPYVSVFAKDAGKVRHCMVMRDYYIHDSAPLDEPVQAVFDRKAHLYEALSGRYLGYGDSLDMTLTDYTLRIFSLLPYRVERMELRAPSGATAGSDAVISAALAVAGGPADSHWFRVEATRPDGRACEAYSANVEAKGGAAEVRIPFALNDPAGAWKVRVRDVATGVAAESRIEVKQP